jgi:hypothetical protein
MVGAKNENMNYSIKSTGQSSDKFGRCELCGCHVSEVYYQTATQTITDIDGDFETFVNLDVAFGHKDCLIKSRNQ